MDISTKPYLTAELPGVGGSIKETDDDFIVTEIPSYLPCGEGEHVYLTLEKRGLTTLEAIRRIARDLALSDRDIGYAGMKDARGVTRQTISIPRVPPERLLALDLPGIIPLAAKKHRNKLKLGHSAGNAFSITIRGVSSDAFQRTTAILAYLDRRGVPNYFGVQRYGTQGNSHLVGQAWLAANYREVADRIIGSPDAVKDERWQTAIAAYHRGDLEESAQAFPPHCRTEREIVQRLLKTPENYKRAVGAVHPRLKMLYFSALQSGLFDEVVAARLSSLDTVMVGDLAWKHDNGACFLVQDVAVDAVRAAQWQISASGPMFGGKMKQPEGVPLMIEGSVLSAAGLTADIFSQSPEWSYPGERRPLRVPLREVSLTEAPEGLQISFALPPGAYATSVLREVMKTGEL